MLPIPTSEEVVEGVVTAGVQFVPLAFRATAALGDALLLMFFLCAALTVVTVLLGTVLVGLAGAGAVWWFRARRRRQPQPSPPMSETEKNEARGLLPHPAGEGGCGPAPPPRTPKTQPPTGAMRTACNLTIVIASVLAIFLFATKSPTAAAAVAVTTLPGTTGHVTLRQWPRSQFDPMCDQYAAARMVATMAVRECLRYGPSPPSNTHSSGDGGVECLESRDAWRTAVSRDPAWGGYMAEAEAQHHYPPPHLFEIYRTTDSAGLLYEELWPRDRQTDLPPYEPCEGTLRADVECALLEAVRLHAKASEAKMVLRWEAGRLWPIPPVLWTPGERALHTGTGLVVERLSTTSTPASEPYDPRPVLDFSQSVPTPPPSS